MRLNYFNFKELDSKYLLTNDFGDNIFLEKDEFYLLITGKIPRDSVLAQKVTSSRMAFEGTNLAFSGKNTYDMREGKRYAATATSLHIFVVTTSCNLGCIYCQANNGRTTPTLLMDTDTAEKAVDIALQSPERNLTFEFQGGEPLMNFEIIRHIVEYAEQNKKDHYINYSIVSNLTLLTEEILEYLIKYDFGISTSIDGNQAIHDSNRPFKSGEGSFSKVAEKLQSIRKQGISIGAIQTTTKAALPHPKEIVDAYVDLEFNSIFIRPLTPLGKALAGWETIGYTPDEFIQFYSRSLDEIIQYNKKGIRIREEHAAIFLRKIRGEGINYMELRSPCGGGIGQIAYYSDGRIFTCDEGRMLAEMGNDAFCIGNVKESTYKELIMNPACRTVCSASILESIPSCCDCVYQPYCGVCPVVNYALSGDIIEKEPRSYRCRIYSGMLDYIFHLLNKNDRETIDILDSWR